MIATKDSSATRITKSNLRIIRSVTSILSYLFILVCSGMIIYFANRRGNPDILKILYYIALGFNVVQIGLIISKFVIQQLGIFDRLLYKLETILAIIWELILVAQFICACIFFEAFRLDSMIISIVQGFAIVLLLLYSRKIDFKVNKKYNRKSKNEDAMLHSDVLIKRRDAAKNILYIFACFCIFVLELAVLVLPKLPPKIDDIFADTRVLQYTYIENEKDYQDGYYVSGIYYGTNNKVVIPLTYNEKPVVGILKNAITDEGKIDSIQIGEYNESGVLVSNVVLIESNAINLNRIKEIDLPNSLKTIEEKAIVGKEIHTINAYFDCSFKMNCFDMDNLSLISLKNEKSVVEADYQNCSIGIDVPATLYNSYREQFFDSRNVFDLISDENYIVVDFETNTDKYLASKILDKSDAKLDITALKNEGEETSSFIKDTVLYNAYNYTSEGFESKDGYAFRGWYRDDKYTLECDFSNSKEVNFSADTTIYARWDKIKTVELDWSNYFPYNEAITTIHFVASDDINESITLPKLQKDGGDVTRIGFSALKWKNGDETVEKTLDLFNCQENTIRLKAEWNLERPEVSYETKVNNTTYQGSNLTFGFDEAQIVNYIASFSHASDKVAITCNWKKQKADGSYELVRKINTTNQDIFNYSLRNVADSGIYQIEIVATADTGETSTISQGYTININKKDIDISSFGTVSPETRVYNGKSQDLNYTYAVPSTIKVSREYDINGTYSSIVGPINARAEAYGVRYTFENISEERDNYNVAYSYSAITIIPKPVTAIWEQSDIKWNSDFEVVYDGNPHNLVPTVNGKCGTDTVDFIISNSSETNAGTYISSIIGVSNPNYTLDTTNIVSSHVWKIKPKQISVSWGNTQKQYTGSTIGFDLTIEGLANKDKNNVSLDNFSCITTCEAKSYVASTGKFTFSAKNIGTYNILLDKFNNANYVFEPVEKTVEITKATLSASWSNTSTVYNGSEQFGKLTISGFKQGDEKKYTDALLNNHFVINSDCAYKIISQTNGKLEVAFYATNVGTYDIELEKIVNDNYTISKAVSQFKIEPKELTGSWVNTTLTYNGTNQYKTYRISGLSASDINKMSIDDFVINFDGVKYELIKNASSGYVDIRFYAQNAGLYDVSITAIDTGKFYGNFSFSNTVDYSFNIKQLTLDVEWENPSFTYDDTEKVIRVSNIKNACGNDVIDLVYTNNKATNAGTYVASITTSNPNYTTSSNNNKEWTIQKKALNVSIEVVDKENKIISNPVYNGQYKYFKVKYSGFMGNDLSSIVNSNFSYSFNNSDITKDTDVVEGNYYVSKFRAINAKDYEITLTSHGLDNYTISTTVSEFSIDKLKAELSWNYTSPFTYSRTAYTVSATISNRCTREDTDLTDTVQAYISNNSYTNAGDYTASVTGVNNSNYYVDLTNNKLNWTILRRTVVIDWTDNDFTFNAVHQAKTATATNLCNYDTISFSYSYSVMNSAGIYGSYIANTSTINKGNYKVKVTGISGTSAANYQLPETVQETTYEIAARKLTATISSSDYTYNGSSVAVVTLKLSNFPTATEANNFSASNIDSQSNTVLTKVSTYSSYCEFGFMATNAGAYEAIVNGCKNNENYIFDACSDTALIKQRVVSLSWTNTTYTYDGTAKQFSATISNLVGNDSVPITYLYSGASYLGQQITSNTMTDAGVYTVKITSVGNDNYTIVGASNLEKTFTINRKDISVTYTGTSHTYNGNYQGLTLTISGYVTKDKALFESNPLVYTHSGNTSNDVYSLASLKLTSVNAGSYNVKVVGLTSKFDNSNYRLSSTVDTTYTISPKTVTVSWSSNSLTYNGETQYITPTISSSSIYTNVLTGNKDVVELTYSGNSGIDATSYTAKLTGISNSNYKLPSTTTKSWTINKKVLQLTWSNNTTFTYDGQPHTVTLTVSGFEAKDLAGKTASNFTASSGATMSISQFTVSNTNAILSFVQTNAGSYSYQLSSISGATNYTFSSTKGTMTVNKKVVELDWDYVAPFTYDGTTHVVNCTVKNACVNNETGTKDTVTVTLSNYSKTNAGTYTATATKLSNSNYELPTANTKSWSINKVKLTATWDSMNDFTYDGLSHSMRLTVKGFVSDDGLDLTTSSFTASRTYTISKESNNVVLSFSIKDAGDYTVNVSALNNQNYIFDATSNSVSIEKAPLSIVWSGNNFVYDGASHTIKATITGFVNGEESSQALSNFVRSFDINPTLSYNNGAVILSRSIKDAGTYSFSISGYNGNYSLSAASTKTIVVSPKAVTIQWSGNDTYTYSGASQGKTLFISGIVSDDISSFKNYLSVSGDITPTITQSATGLEYYFGATAAKSTPYSFSIASKSTLKNYTFTSQNNISFSINPKTLSVEWSTSTGNLTDVYDGQEKTITLSIIGFVNAEKYTSSYFTTNCSVASYDNSVAGTLKLVFKAKDSGVYSINVSKFNNSNYSFNSTSKTYTVNPKALAATWVGSSSTYSGQEQGYELIITGMINSDINSIKNNLLCTGDITPKVTSDTTRIIYSFKAVDAGEYSVCVKANSVLKNYTLIQQTKSFEIEQRVVTANINSSDGSISFSNVVSGESITGYKLEVFSDANHENMVSTWVEDGVYYYVVELLSAKNYVLANSEGSFEVGEA